MNQNLIDTILTKKYNYPYLINTEESTILLEWENRYKFDNVCSICFDEYNENDKNKCLTGPSINKHPNYKPICNHIACSNCWKLLDKNECCICRRDVTKWLEWYKISCEINEEFSENCFIWTDEMKIMMIVSALDEDNLTDKQIKLKENIFKCLNKATKCQKCKCEKKLYSPFYLNESICDSGYDLKAGVILKALVSCNHFCCKDCWKENECCPFDCCDTDELEYFFHSIDDDEE